MLNLLKTNIMFKIRIDEYNKDRKCFIISIETEMFTYDYTFDYEPTEQTKTGMIESFKEWKQSIEEGSDGILFYDENKDIYDYDNQDFNANIYYHHDGNISPYFEFVSVDESNNDQKFYNKTSIKIKYTPEIAESFNKCIQTLIDSI
jgi:hypothetical protein